MDVPELRFLFSILASKMKWCRCGSGTPNMNKNLLLSSLTPSISPHIQKQFEHVINGKINSENDRNMNQAKGNLSIECPYCCSDLSTQEKEMIDKMKTGCLQILQQSGIDLNSTVLPEFSKETEVPECADYTIKCDVKYLKRNAKGETPLHTAARKKDLQSVITMLKDEVNPNTQDNAGWTPLHEAIFDDNFEITSSLLSAGAIVNVPGYDFTTPLHIAAHHNNLQMVLLLLKFGADPSARDIYGRCPEYYARDTEIISHLKEYSSSTDTIELAKKFQKSAAPRPIVVYLCDESALDVEERNHLETILDVKITCNLDKTVTHVVVTHTGDNVCDPSSDVMKAILFGCVLVNKYWLAACRSYRELINFSDYEVNGTTKFPTSNGPRKARQNFFHLNPSLFTGCHIFLKKSQQICILKDLVLASGAKLLNREPNPEHSPTDYYLFHCPVGHDMENTSTIILYEEGPREPKLKYNMKHIKSLPIQWFYDCIQNFSILEPEMISQV